MKSQEINLMIQSAEQVWNEIQTKLVGTTDISMNYLATKKEELKDLLEAIRLKVEESLKSGENLIDDCKNFLSHILQLSENLRVSYVFPGYMESYYIFDTLRSIKGNND